MFFRKILNEYKLRRKFKKIGLQYAGWGEFEGLESAHIDRHVYIGPGAYWSCIGGLTVGRNVIFGPRSTIWTTNHNYNGKMLPYDEELIFKPVVIENNVWIGLGVTLLPGSLIEEGAIIGAGSVVRGRVPKCSVAIGNPAQVVGKRNGEKYDELMKEQAFYQVEKMR